MGFNELDNLKSVCQGIPGLRYPLWVLGRMNVPTAYNLIDIGLNKHFLVMKTASVALEINTQVQAPLLVAFCNGTIASPL